MGTGLKKLSFVLGLFGALSGCATVITVRQPELQVFTAPDYQRVRPIFFWGFVPAEGDLDVSAVCLGKKINQVSTTLTTGNFLATLFTVGIYSPRTVRVWCSL